MLLDFTIDMASRYIKKKEKYTKKEEEEEEEEEQQQQQQQDEELKIKIKSEVYLALLRIR